MDKIKIGIYGYGNLGKGVETAIYNNEDVELVGVFTRRDPSTLKTLHSETKVFSVDDVKNMQNKIDVMILCGGSATDLPKQTPKIAKLFNTVDSFDTHAKIPEYFKSVNTEAKESNHLSLISCGWDPGLFSLNRALLEAILPTGNNYVFYGKGLSQGHSDAIRRINGVKNAVQYTVPYEEAVEKVRSGENPNFSSISFCTLNISLKFFSDTSVIPYLNILSVLLLSTVFIPVALPILSAICNILSYILNPFLFI